MITPLPRQKIQSPSPRSISYPQSRKSLAPLARSTSRITTRTHSSAQLPTSTSGLRRSPMSIAPSSRMCAPRTIQMLTRKKRKKPANVSWRRTASLGSHLSAGPLIGVLFHACSSESTSHQKQIPHHKIPKLKSRVQTESRTVTARSSQSRMLAEVVQSC
ncbi:uncharacterized protein MYCFIDRAFT_87249 [Pseudocercospora fijiensis CIRAD86]|uniref:Uncharacterized protein n=1 Tax=Pseudocercospora fijiensis (strain CIRAD86) TaxID=383855 RepID=M2YJL4_PSEFD|nr:uncharacterized protein MYCFIDRAFT_87249 [Pseudocercospora fijiensis CIRAD86]EME77940.1 hypothetical protein MYCFIDRAFT_87249 [Pseudocercospora fijiensis CIRAD86]